MSQVPPAYQNYWERKRLLKSSPGFPVVRWWPGEGMSDVERIYLGAIQPADAVLDFGAGDLKLMQKFQRNGYAGTYETLDIGDEYAYTYRDLSEVKRKFGAIVCFDVIEHMPLNDGLTLLKRLADLLEDGGALVVQTPNANCIRNPMAWDMTHVQIYKVSDLWAYLTSLGMEVQGYRVRWCQERESLIARMLAWVSRAVTIKILRCDYADNIALVARKVAR